MEMKKTEKKCPGTARRTKAVLEEMSVNPSYHTSREEGAAAPCDTMEALCYDWLGTRYDAVKKSTYSAYNYCIRIHILPYLGTVSLSALDGGTVLSFIEKTQEKGLADTTMNFIFSTLKFIVKYGVRCGLIDKEILEYCSVSFHKTESRVLMVQDSIRMKEYLLKKNTIFSVSILLCRSTGIRIGELCGLKWGDIDFTSNTFWVRRTVSRIPNPDNSDGQPKTILYIRTPKSYTSAREIPIPGYLINAFKSMRKTDDLYLLTGKNSCTEPRNVQKKFKTILRRCEMQDCNFHAMRHGFATACLENGVDCKTVSSILGHASIRTTMDFYLHTSMRQKQSCIDSID